MIVLLVFAGTVAIAGVLAAMTWRNPVHSILALAVGLVGLAGVYLALGAQFAGFTQILVYVGAVAILAVFALMMTRAGEADADAKAASTSTGGSGAVVALLVFAVLAWVAHSYHSSAAVEVWHNVSVAEIGRVLMHSDVLPLEIIGVLLTAALIGAVIVAMPERQEKP